MDVEARLAELGIELPQAPAPIAAYVPAVRTGNLVFVSGQIPVRDGKPVHTGKVGAEVMLEEGQQAARLCCLNALAALRSAAGNLNDVGRIIRLGVFVAAAKDFTDHAKVANSSSELLEQVFGEAGRHARATVGVASLPLGVPVEIEMLAELAEEARPNPAEPGRPFAEPA
jgi:enamine deaminase RidA (YjgF/YER057c/UK114 family)